MVGGAGRDKVLDLEEKVEKEVVGKKVEVDKEQVDMKDKSCLLVFKFDLLLE